MNKEFQMKLNEQLENMARLIAEKTKDCLASIHIDAAGLIRLGETHDERLENFNQLILRAESLGGKIMIPTFSYTYPKKMPFNLLETPSDVGIVTEYLRKKNPLKRTADGMFSYLLFNNDQNSSYFNVEDYEIFGDDSLIGELFNSNGYICCIGNVFHNTPTEVHFLERLLNVPYRFNKTMSGGFIDKQGKSIKQNLIFYCRDLDYNMFSDMTRLETSLRNNDCFDYWEKNNLDFVIEAVRFKKIFEIIKIEIEKDPMFLCSEYEDKRNNLQKRRLLSRFNQIDYL